MNDTERQAWIINLIRSLFALLASAQLLHAAFSYRYDQNAKNILYVLINQKSKDDIHILTLLSKNAGTMKY